jgi:hypothetical protein
VQVGEVRQYSDRLLMFLLQAKRPEVYRPVRVARPAVAAAPRAAEPAAATGADDWEEPMTPEMEREYAAAYARMERLRAAGELPARRAGTAAPQPAPPRPAEPPPPAPVPPPLPPYVLEGRQPTSAEAMQYMDLSGLKLPYNRPRQEPPPRDDDDDPPPPSWRPYAAPGGMPADEDGEEEGYEDEWTGGHGWERTAQAAGTAARPPAPRREQPGPVIVRARTPRDAPILQATNEYLPRASHGEGGAQRRMGKGRGVGGKLGGALVCLRTGLDIVSRLSHRAHPMPILRAFRHDDRVSPAAFRRLGCLISGLRVPSAAPA